MLNDQTQIPKQRASQDNRPKHSYAQQVALSPMIVFAKNLKRTHDV